jgi:hypothetical protein
MTTAIAERESLIKIIENLPDAGIGKLASYAAFLQSEYATGYDDDFFSEPNMTRLQHSIQQMEQGHFVVKTMDELERMADE